MSLSETIKLELHVAFSKESQPVWFRVLKYVLIIGFVYFFWNTRVLWIGLISLVVCSLLLHFWYRYKTQRWTRSYGFWKSLTEKK